MYRALTLILCVLCCTAPAVSPEAIAESPRTAAEASPFAASTIVSLHSTPYGEDPIPVLRAWEVDCVGWGLPPVLESGVEDWARAWTRKHLDAGVRYHAVLNLNLSNGYLTGPHPELLTTRCVTAGGDFHGPGHTGVLGVINGQPSWFHCVNHPEWRAALKRIAGYIIAAGAQGFVFDGPLSNASAEFRRAGICFCEHCLTGFEATDPALEVKGAELKKRLAAAMAATPTYPEDVLLQRYLIYQAKTAVACMKDVIAHARSLRPEGLQFTANVFDMQAEALAFIPHCDWLLTEMSHYTDLWGKGTIERSLSWRYRLSDAFGKRMVATAPLWEWKYLQDRKCDDLLKLWFAAAYAHGHLFTVPNYYSWSGIPYRGDAEAFAPLIRFVKDNARLLDDYVHRSAAAVVFCPDDFSDIIGLQTQPTAELMDISTTFSYRQLDFDFVMASHSFFEGPVWSEAPLLIVPKTARLAETDRERIREYEKKDRLVRWPDDRLRIGALQTIHAPEGVWIKHRVHRTDPKRQVLHLLNGHFDYEANRVKRQTDVTIRMTRPEGWQGVVATWHAPGGPSTKLNVSPAGDRVEMTVPALDHWGILELAAAAP